MNARGTNAPQRGDFTGRTAVAQQDRKADQEVARRNTINGLSERTVLVEVPGGRSYLIPREAFDEIFARGEKAGH